MEQGLLQLRVGKLGRLVTVLGALGLVARLVLAIISGRPEIVSGASLVLYVVAILPFTGLWLFCRQERSERTLQTAELSAVFVSSLAFALLFLWAAGKEVNRPELVAIIVVTLALMARAGYVPSTARRTLVVGVACGLPVLVTTFVVYASRPDTGQRILALTALSAPRYAGVVGFTTTVWLALSIGLATSISGVIYGLRTQVQHAERLGQYTLVRKLGEGGMGAVYEAKHAFLRRPTAVKLLAPGKSSANHLARFEREVQLTARLTHPNTIRVFDYGRTPDGVLYYAMELLDGASLEDVVEVGGPQPVGRVIHVLCQAAAALAEAHSVGLIHRDVKPANLMLCEQGGVLDVVKVLDFGLVKVQQEEGLDPLVTAADTLLGTPLYISPEAIRSPALVDPRSDLYSLGAVGYYLLTGQHVFSAHSAVEVFMAHLHTAPVPPSERLGRELPAPLQQILLRCLEKDPAQRPASAAELLSLLEAMAGAEEWDQARAREWWQAHAAALAERKGKVETDAGRRSFVVDVAARV